MSQSRTPEPDPAIELRRSLALLWETPAVSSRGPRPGLTVPQIVTAAVALADAEGLAALSMRNLAAALDVGTMTLYRYVPGRAELVALMCDHIYATPGADAPSPDAGWRERLTAVAMGHWRMCIRHPWLLTIEQGRPLMGPRAMQATEGSLAALHGTRLDDGERLGVLVLITSFVAGVARTEIESTSAAGRTGIPDETWWGAHLPYLEPTSDRYPRLVAAGEAGSWGEGSSERNLRLGLEIVLDGIAARIAAR